MKKMIWLVVLLLSITITGAKEVTLFYDGFDDDSLNYTRWTFAGGGNFWVQNGELHSEGLIADGSGLRKGMLYALMNRTNFNENMSISLKVRLNGNSDNPGKSVYLTAADLLGINSYSLRVIKTKIDSSLLYVPCLSFGLGTTKGLSDLLTSNFAPELDRKYYLKASRGSSGWSFYIDNELIGTSNDPLGITVFDRVILHMVGSVTIDDINITIDVPEDVPPQPEVDPLLLKYAPIIHMHPSEYYNPKGIDSMLNLSDLKNGNGVIVKQMPLAGSDLIGLDNSADHYIDLTNSDFSSSINYPDPTDFKDYPVKIYGRIIKDNNYYTHLQYFVFYPYQKWYGLNHEGDWEMVQVTLEPSGSISSVIYPFGYFTAAYYDVDMLDMVDYTHPPLFVAKGSHNSYADDQPISIVASFMFVNNLMGRFKELENVKDGGQVIKPNGMELSSNDISYDLEQIDSDTPWVSYKGLWGEKTASPTNNGVKGPRYNPRLFQRWNNPEDYSYAPDIPFMAAFLYSPLDMTVTDANNKKLDFNSEETFFYTGADSEPEAFMIKQNGPVTLNLDAVADGNFTLELYYFDGNNGIMVRYSNISNYKSTKARVEITGSSDFVLHLDLEGDGVFEKLVYPDDVVTYKDFTFNDKDKDGVVDSLDNCKELFNNNQLDSDNDALGDVCDPCPFDASNDEDKDSFCGSVDNCPILPNSDQLDTDYDNIGDACDSCPLDQANDIDKDGICGNNDNCPGKANNLQEDCDGDGIGDVCDINSRCSTDTDKDGAMDDKDNCINIPNPTQTDYNKNGLGDACDNPKYYKLIALERLRQLNSSTQVDRNKNGWAIKGVEGSLTSSYWKDEFNITTKQVFIDEAFAAAYTTDSQTERYLVKADEMIVSRAMNGYIGRSAALVKYLYNAGNTLASQGRYELAILSYMEAWNLVALKK